MMRASLKDIERFIECVEQGLPYVISCWANAPELYAAMDVYYNAISISYSGIDYDTHLKDLERADQLGLPPDLCTVHRLVIRSIEDGDVPIPRAICGILEPCDGMPLVQNTLTQHKDWVDVPFF